MKRMLYMMFAIVLALIFAGCPVAENIPPDDIEPEDPAVTTYAVTLSPTGAESGESVTADVSEAAEGDTVTLTAALNSGRRVALSASGVTISPSTISSDGETASFTMAASTVTVAANFYAAETHTANSVDFTMHHVSSGCTFTMGEHFESTMQDVTLTKDFWIGETEVTQGLWEDVWGTTWPGTDPENSDYGTGANYPAYFINCYDAAAFCNLLTLADGNIEISEVVYYSDEILKNEYSVENAVAEDAVYVDWDKTGYRLTTEAEWEYAARYIDGSSWNNGDHASGDTEYACYDPGGGPVSGSPLASDDRISEYAWWAVYSGGSETDPRGPENGSFRIIRGGFYENSGGSHLRCAYRTEGYSPSERIKSIGFRLCRTAD